MEKTKKRGSYRKRPKEVTDQPFTLAKNSPGYCAHYYPAQNDFLNAIAAPITPTRNRFKIRFKHLPGLTRTMHPYSRVFATASAFCTHIFLDISQPTHCVVYLKTRQCLSSQATIPYFTHWLQICGLTWFGEPEFKPEERKAPNVTFAQFVGLHGFNEENDEVYCSPDQTRLCYTSTNDCSLIQRYHDFAAFKPDNATAQMVSQSSRQYQMNSIIDFVSAEVNHKLTSVKEHALPFYDVESHPFYRDMKDPHLISTIARCANLRHQVQLQIQTLAAQYSQRFLTQGFISKSFFQSFQQQAQTWLNEIIINTTQAFQELSEWFETCSVQQQLAHPKSSWLFKPSLNQHLHHQMHRICSDEGSFIPFDELPVNTFLQVLLVAKAAYEYTNNVQGDNNGRSIIFYGNAGAGKTGLCDSFDSVFRTGRYDVSTKTGFQDKSLLDAQVFICDELHEKDFFDVKYKQILDFEQSIEINCKFGPQQYAGKNTLRLGSSNDKIEQLLSQPEFYQRNNFTPNKVASFSAVLRRLMFLNVEMTDRHFKRLTSTVGQGAKQFLIDNIRTFFLIGWLLNGQRCEPPVRFPLLAFEFDPSIYDKLYQNLYNQLMLSRGNYLLKRFALLVSTNQPILADITRRLSSFPGQMQSSYLQNLTYFTSPVSHRSKQSPQSPIKVRQTLMSQLHDVCMAPFELDLTVRAQFGATFGLTFDCESYFASSEFSQLCQTIALLSDAQLFEPLVSLLDKDVLFDHVRQLFDSSEIEVSVQQRASFSAYLQRFYTYTRLAGLITSQHLAIREEKKVALLSELVSVNEVSYQECTQQLNIDNIDNSVVIALKANQQCNYHQEEEISLFNQEKVDNSLEIWKPQQQQ